MPPMNSKTTSWRVIDTKVLGAVAFAISILLLLNAVSFFTGLQEICEEGYTGLLGYYAAHDALAVGMRSLIDAAVLACLGYGLWHIKRYAWYLNVLLIAWNGVHTTLEGNWLGLWLLEWMLGVAWTVYRFPLYHSGRFERHQPE